MIQINTFITEPENDSEPFTPNQLIYGSLAVGILVFSLSLLGIFTRPTGLLAAFWPANAVLLGIFIRMPSVANPLSWLMALIGYIAADSLTGLDLSVSLFLTCGNFAGVLMGFWLFKKLSKKHRRLKQPLSVIFLLLISIASSGAAGIIGMIGYPIFFGGMAQQGFSYWFASELVNFLAILPVILTAPVISLVLKNRRQKTSFQHLNMQKIFALLALIGGGVLGILIGGPGALSFIIPGLIWCALTYSVFVTALLTLAFSIWLLLSVSTGMLDIGVNMRDLYSLESFRLGVTFIALAPLTIAIIMSIRNELLRKLRHSSTHDQLTNVSNRVGFYEKTKAVLAKDKSFAVLMCDLDHFKQVNDRYGHISGDHVLSEFTKRTKLYLRDSDVFGRLGGEEFGIIISDCSVESATVIAQRICLACSSNDFVLGDKTRLKVTVSIGLVYMSARSSSLETILAKADEALYEAKRTGRNKVVIGRDLSHELTDIERAS